VRRADDLAIGNVGADDLDAADLGGDEPSLRVFRAVVHALPDVLGFDPAQDAYAIERRLATNRCVVACLPERGVRKHGFRHRQDTTAHDRSHLRVRTICRRPDPGRGGEGLFGRVADFGRSTKAGSNDSEISCVVKSKRFDPGVHPRSNTKLRAGGAGRTHVVSLQLSAFACTAGASASERRMDGSQPFFASQSRLWV